jgi:hypothetical protein
MNETYTCCICESKVDEKDIRHIEVKDKVKDICKECITAIKGLM